MIKTGIASVALAASAIIIAAPASAGPETSFRSTSGSYTSGRQIHRVNDWGQSRVQTRRLRRNAIEACTYKLKADARAYGYRRARVTDFRAEQVGPRRFRVYTQANLFDGYRVRRDNFSCVVRRGDVVRTSDITPARFRRGRRGGGFQHNRGRRISTY